MSVPSHIDHVKKKENEKGRTVKEAVGYGTARRDRLAIVLRKRFALGRRVFDRSAQLVVVARLDVASVVLVKVAQAVVDVHVALRRKSRQR